MARRLIPLFVEKCNKCNLKFEATGYSKKQAKRRLEIHQTSSKCRRNRK